MFKLILKYVYCKTFGLKYSVYHWLEFDDIITNRSNEIHNVDFDCWFLANVLWGKKKYLIYLRPEND